MGPQAGVLRHESIVLTSAVLTLAGPRKCACYDGCSVQGSCITLAMAPTLTPAVCAGVGGRWCSEPSAALRAAAVKPDEAANLTCAAVKQRGACPVARSLGVCSCSCGGWPGGCRDTQGFGWKSTGGDTCADVERKAWCSLTTAGNVGPGWRSSRPLSSVRDSTGVGAPEACCVCGGGLYPPSGAPHSSRHCPQ